MHKKNIVECAREMLNTPFLHQGRLPNHGLDCGGLVICSMVAAGYNPKDLANYPEIPDGSFIKLVEEQSDLVALNEVMAGDIMMFKWLQDPQHIAIVTQTDPIHIVHTWNAVGRVVENGLDEYWRKRLVACYRIRGLD